MAEPVTIAAIISAIVAAGTAAAKAGGRRHATAPIRKRNKAEIARLQGLEESGQFGLTGEEHRTLQNALVSPVQAAALSARQRSERIGAASRAQGFGARELSGLRQEQARTEGSARAQANAQIFAADQSRARQQGSELEARLSARGARQIAQLEADLGVVEALGSAIGPLGAAAAQNQLGQSLAAQFDLGNLTSAELQELLSNLDSESAQALLSQAGRQ